MRVLDFYYARIDDMTDTPLDLGRRKDIYPLESFIRTSIETRTFYLLKRDNILTGAMILTHDSTEGYNKVEWTIDASDDDVIVIHTLAISPTHCGQGLAQQLIDFAIAYSTSNR